MSKDQHTEVTKISAIDEDILTVLKGRELYGLSILDELNLNRPNPLSFGSLYPALNRLEKKGYLSWRWGDEQESSRGARRKYYQVTGLGINALTEVQEYRRALARRAAENTGQNPAPANYQWLNWLCFKPVGGTW